PRNCRPRTPLPGETAGVVRPRPPGDRAENHPRRLQRVDEGAGHQDALVALRKRGHFPAPEAPPHLSGAVPGGAPRSHLLRGGRGGAEGGDAADAQGADRLGPPAAGGDLPDWIGQRADAPRTVRRRTAARTNCGGIARRRRRLCDKTAERPAWLAAAATETFPDDRTLGIEGLDQSRPDAPRDPDLGMLRGGSGTLRRRRSGPLEPGAGVPDLRTNACRGAVGGPGRQASTHRAGPRLRLAGLDVLAVHHSVVLRQVTRRAGLALAGVAGGLDTVALDHVADDCLGPVHDAMNVCPDAEARGQTRVDGAVAGQAGSERASAAASSLLRILLRPAGRCGSADGGLRGSRRAEG